MLPAEGGGEVSDRPQRLSFLKSAPHPGRSQGEQRRRGFQEAGRVEQVGLRERSGKRREKPAQQAGEHE